MEKHGGTANHQPHFIACEEEEQWTGSDRAGVQAGRLGSAVHLFLRVRAQDGSEVFFKVKRSVMWGEVMTAYCHKVGVAFEQVRYLFDGRRLRPDQTPADFDMKDNDTIDAMLQV